MAQTWERCQQQLFLHALQPHPLTACVLGSVWADLAAVSSEALLKAHISALHDLVHVAAAAGAAGGHGPPSPLYSQLLGLLACLLAAAPAPTQDAFFAHFLQASGRVGTGEHVWTNMQLERKASQQQICKPGCFTTLLLRPAHRHLLLPTGAWQDARRCLPAGLPRS